MQTESKKNIIGRSNVSLFHLQKNNDEHKISRRAKKNVLTCLAQCPLPPPTLSKDLYSEQKLILFPYVVEICDTISNLNPNSMKFVQNKRILETATKLSSI